MQVQIPGLGRSPGGGHGNLLQYLAWRSLRTMEPSGIQSIELQRVGHKRSYLAHTHAFISLHQVILNSITLSFYRFVL